MSPAPWTPDRVLRDQTLAGITCVVFLGKTLYSHRASLHPAQKCKNAGGGGGGGDGLASHPERVEKLLVT